MDMGAVDSRVAAPEFMSTREFREATTRLVPLPKRDQWVQMPNGLYPQPGEFRGSGQSRKTAEIAPAVV